MRNLLILFSLAAFAVSCQSGSSKVKLTNQTDSVSYIMGLSDGERLYQSFVQAKLDSVVKIDKYFKGIIDITTEKNVWLEPDSNQQIVQDFFMKYRQFRTLSQNDTTGTVKFEPNVNQLDSISYLMGASDARGLMESFKRAGIDSIISMDIYIKGLSTTGKNLESPIDVEANMELVNKFFEKIQQDRLMAEFGDNLKAGEEFLAKNTALQNITTTESGLQYEVIKQGNGEKPTAMSQVKVHYHGTLLDGTVFDSSVDRGEPATFGVSQVIPGWTEALQLMSVGSKFKLYIPQNLAYGSNVRPGGPIEPFMMLIFEVELLDIVK